MNPALNKSIRVLLSSLPKRYPAASEEYMLAKLAEFYPGGLTRPELADACNWNYAKGYIDWRKNADTEATEWFLTDAGKIKEGVA